MKNGIPYLRVEGIKDYIIKVFYLSKKYGEWYVIINKEDFIKIKDIRWQISKSGNTSYAVAFGRKQDGTQTTIRMHRLIMGNPKYKVDHKDMNGLNNTRQNLRVASSAQNRANSKKPSTNTTGFKGVFYCNTFKAYKVCLTYNGKSYYGGTFTNVLSAARKYNELALKYNGEFAGLNKFTEKQLQELQKLPHKEGKRPKSNKYGYIGIGVDKDRPNKYKAVISINKKVIKIGNYATAIEAARAYDIAAIKHYGKTKAINNV